MGWGPDAPKPPDPKETADAQFNYSTGSSMASGILNNPNVYTPYGSTTYSRESMEKIRLPDGTVIKVPRYAQTTNFNSTGQRLFNQQQELAGDSFRTANRILDQGSRKGAVPWDTDYRVGRLDTNFRNDTNSLGFYTNAIRANLGLDQNANTRSFDMLRGLSGDIVRSYDQGKDFSADRARVENAVYGRGSRVLNEDRQAENARLAAMGLAPGTAANDRAQGALNARQNDLAMAAVLAGGDEQSRLLGESRAAAEFRNNAAGQEYAQRFGLISAENARKMGDTQLKNAAKQGEFAMRTSLREMENARRSGDMLAYNAALEAYNNAQIGQTALRQGKANFRNTVRSAQVGERESLKNAEINRLISILSGAQVQGSPIPGYNTQGVAAPDYSGLVSSNYSNQVAAHNANLAAISGLVSGGVDLWKGWGS